MTVEPVQAKMDGADLRTVLTFDVDGEVCGVDLSSVVEVVEYHGVTRVPFSPPHVLGVFNLRGDVLPVVDLASRLGLRRAGPTRKTCIVIVLSSVAGETVRVGLLADSVRTVLAHGVASVEAPPQMGTRVSAGFLRGIVGDAAGFVFLLDLDETLSLVDVVAPGSASPTTDVEQSRAHGGRSRVEHPEHD